MNLRPTVLNICTGDLPFLAPIAGLKGQLSSTIGAFVHSILWVAGSGCPFLFYSIQEMENQDSQNRNKIKEVLIKTLSFLPFLLIAPFMILFAFGFPLLALACIYFFFTIGGFEYAIGILIFGGLSFIIWEEKL